MDRELNTSILVKLIKTMKERKCKVVDLVDVLVKDEKDNFFEYNGENYNYRTVYFECIRDNYNILKEIENSFKNNNGSYEFPTYNR